jgi:hypothetical protein
MAYRAATATISIRGTDVTIATGRHVVVTVTGARSRSVRRPDDPSPAGGASSPARTGRSAGPAARFSQTPGAHGIHRPGLQGLTTPQSGCSGSVRSDTSQGPTARAPAARRAVPGPPGGGGTGATGQSRHRCGPFRRAGMAFHFRSRFRSRRKKRSSGCCRCSYGSGPVGEQPPLGLVPLEVFAFACSPRSGSRKAQVSGPLGAWRPCCCWLVLGGPDLSSRFLGRRPLTGSARMQSSPTSWGCAETMTLSVDPRLRISSSGIALGVFFWLPW